jgi:two-component system chemotaxis response regulator CheB
MENRIIRVLVVDDSAYVRKVVTQMLTRSPFIEVVGTARDGQHALELVEQLQPDVVTLDLLMPVLDGIGFLRQQMVRRPIPVVVCSIASESGEMALRALDAGAVDFVQKPTALATEKVFEISADLIEKVKAAASVQFARLAPLPVPPPAAPPAAPAGAGRVDVVVLGVSTGGPQALRFLMPQLPANLPVPLAIVLHMPVGYTEMYAAKLNEVCSLEFREAHEGDEVRPGLALLAPAGRHLSFVRQPDGQVRAHLDARPFDTPHRPAVDVLFRSAAEVYGSRVLGVVMTGMGSDGKVGAEVIKERGGRIFTEAEESCVVYGMPRSVVEAGLSDKCVHLDRLAQAILEAL